MADVAVAGSGSSANAAAVSETAALFFDGFFTAPSFDDPLLDPAWRPFRDAAAFDGSGTSENAPATIRACSMLCCSADPSAGLERSGRPI